MDTKPASKITKLLDWLVVGVVIITGAIVGWRKVKSYTTGLVNEALVPVSEEVSNLSSSLVKFEEDLVAMKVAPVVAAQPEIQSAPQLATTTEPKVASAIAPSESVAEPKTATGVININTASLSQLMSLPGIGESYATRIVEGRPYSSVEQLTQVKGIGPKTLEKLRDQVTVQ